MKITSILAAIVLASSFAMANEPAPAAAPTAPAAAVVAPAADTAAPAADHGKMHGKKAKKKKGAAEAPATH